MKANESYKKLTVLAFGSNFFEEIGDKRFFLATDNEGD